MTFLSGMDDTNFDLSQTLTYRSVPTTPVPTISVTEASPPSAEEQDTESAGATPQLEVTASESRLVLAIVLIFIIDDQFGETIDCIIGLWITSVLVLSYIISPWSPLRK